MCNGIRQVMCLKMIMFIAVETNADKDKANIDKICLVNKAIFGKGFLFFACDSDLVNSSILFFRIIS